MDLDPKRPLRSLVERAWRGRSSPSPSSFWELGRAPATGPSAAEASRGEFGTPAARDAELPRGDHNANPPDISFLELLREDFETHGRNPLEPGFWAVAVHRFGNWRMGIRPKVVRAPFSMAYKAMFTSVDWLWGIELGYNVKLGRRVRLWHHGTMVLSARAIGDDVHIRHNTTFGVARRDENTKVPSIGDRVDIGVGACILGDVTVGHDTVIGANAVVLKSCPPHSTMVGIPARPVIKSTAAPREAPPAVKRG